MYGVCRLSSFIVYSADLVTATISLFFALGNADTSDIIESAENCCKRVLKNVWGRMTGFKIITGVL